MDSCHPPTFFPSLCSFACCGHGAHEGMPSTAHRGTHSTRGHRSAAGSQARSHPLQGDRRVQPRSPHASLPHCAGSRRIADAQPRDAPVLLCNVREEGQQHGRSDRKTRHPELPATKPKSTTTHPRFRAKGQADPIPITMLAKTLGSSASVERSLEAVKSLGWIDTAIVSRGVNTDASMQLATDADSRQEGFMSG